MRKFSAKDWVLAMLYIVGGKVRGKTRIHKGIFLVHEEVDPCNTPIFEPKDYGPWSYDVEKALEELVDDGLVVVSEKPGGDEAPAQVFELTEKGKEIARNVLKELETHPEYERIKDRLEFAGKAPLTAVLIYVYTLYPEYTRKSRIRAKVASWKYRRNFR